jgi:hypothetical protein
MNRLRGFMHASVLAVGMTAVTGGVPCLAADSGNGPQGNESVTVNGANTRVPMVATTQSTPAPSFPTGAPGLPGPSRPVGTTISGGVLVPRSAVVAGQSNTSTGDRY